jgi:hypothetical protein
MLQHDTPDATPPIDIVGAALVPGPPSTGIAPAAVPAPSMIEIAAAVAAPVSPVVFPAIIAVAAADFSVPPGNASAIRPSNRYVCPYDNHEVWYRASVGEEIPLCAKHDVPYELDMK